MLDQIMSMDFFTVVMGTLGAATAVSFLCATLIV
jgi:hypothetical protein